MIETVAMTRAEWDAEGERLFGKDRMAWRFKCPACGHVATVQDYRDAQAPESAVAFSCVGRWAGSLRDAFGGEGEGPCDYAGGGLFKLCPVRVTNSDGQVVELFEFA